MEPIDIGLPPREESTLDKLERLADEFPEGEFIVESAVVPFGSPDYWLRVLDKGNWNGDKRWRAVSYDTLPQPTPNGTVLQQLVHMERRVQFRDVKPSLLALVAKVREAERERMFGIGDKDRQAMLKQALESVKP